MIKNWWLIEIISINTVDVIESLTISKKMAYEQGGWLGDHGIGKGGGQVGGPGHGDLEGDEVVGQGVSGQDEEGPGVLRQEALPP